MSKLLDDIRRAYRSRESLHQDSTLDTYRLFHGYSEGLPGLEIDRYGSAAVMTSKGDHAELFAAVAECLVSLGGYTSVTAKERGHTPLALVGDMPSTPEVVHELGLRYSVEAWAPLNPGLYLDARSAREWLQDNAQGRRVLNLFAFAGSLGVAAMAGGALSVTHVDTQKRALKRCVTNHELNGQRVDHRDLVNEDVVRFMARAATGRRRYGGVVIDAPPTREGSPQAGKLSPISLAGEASKLVEPGGWMLCFFHHDPRSWDELEEAVSAVVGRRLKVQWRGRSGIDFPELDERQTLRLSSFEV